MKNFNSITEKDILYYAYHGIMEKLDKEQKHLEAHSTSQIAPARIEKYNKQLAEIHARIIEIEHAE
jgi:hypothetical protein